MYRAPLFGTLLGSLLLSAACSNDLGAPQADRYPRPGVLAAPTEEPSSYVTGFAIDPEAFLMNLVACGPTCPIPPLLLDVSPLYLSSMVRTAPVTLLDPAAGAPVAPPGLSSDEGTWALPKVKSATATYLPLSVGGDSAKLATNVPSPVPLANIPPAGRYLSTVTLRPVAPAYPQCIAVEAVHTSDNGVLEAVAKYLTIVEKQNTTVADLINPARYSGVNVFWLSMPGFAFLRVPTTPPETTPPPPNPLAVPNTTVKIAQGPASRVFNIQFAPKNDPRLPPEVHALQSARGFFVAPGLESSNVGVVVILHATSTAPFTPVLYQVEDKVTNAAMFRPYKFAPVGAPVIPGLVTAASLQLAYSDAGPPGALPPNFCLPAGP
jgi:hypothetical protein